MARLQYNKVSFTITLPVLYLKILKWVKGDELEVELKQNKLVISKNLKGELNNGDNK